MALPTSGDLAIKSAVGTSRSIACAVDGNLTGDKNLCSLSLSAGKASPHCMREFYGFEPYPNTINVTCSICYVGCNGCTFPVYYTICPPDAEPNICETSGWVQWVHDVTDDTIHTTVNPQDYGASYRGTKLCTIHPNDSGVWDYICICQTTYP